MNSLDIIALVLVSLLWGAQYLFVAKMLVYVPFEQVALTRSLAGMISLVITITVIYFINPSFKQRTFAALFGYSTPEKQDEPFSQRKYRIWNTQKQAFIVGSICHGLGMSSSMFAQGGISSGVISIIFCLEPVFAAFSANILHLSDAPRLTDLFFVSGMLLSTIGVSMVMIPDVMSTNTETAGMSRASSLMKFFFVLASIASPAFYGFGGMVNAKFLKENPIPTLLAVAFQQMWGTIYVIIQGLISGHGVNLLKIPSVIWGYGFIMAISSAVMAWSIFLWLLERIGSKASLYAFITPCISVLLGAVLNEELTGASAAMIALKLTGMLIVFAGLALTLRKDLMNAWASDEKKRMIDTNPTVMKKESKTLDSAALAEIEMSRSIEHVSSV